MNCISLRFHFVHLFECESLTCLALWDPTLPQSVQCWLDKAINRDKNTPHFQMWLCFSRSSRSLMFSWCNEATGANEDEDLLTASSPISHLGSLWRTMHSLWRLTVDRASQDDEGLRGHFGEFMQHYTANRVCIMLTYAMSHSHRKSIIHWHFAG